MNCSIFPSFEQWKNNYFALLFAAIILFSGSCASKKETVSTASTETEPTTPPVERVVSIDLWKDIPESKIEVIGERRIVPSRYRTLQLDFEAMKTQLAQAPLEGKESRKNPRLRTEIPLPGGGIAVFEIVNTPTMAPELAAKFPDIKTFGGDGIELEPGSIKLDHTEKGFHAQILRPNATILIDPYCEGNTMYYIAYYKRDLKNIDKVNDFNE